MAGGHLSGDRSAAAREDAEIHCAGTRLVRRPTSNRDGVTPARGGRRGSKVPHPHIRINLISTISNQGYGPLP